MILTALALVLLAALMHAVWNAMAKRGKNKFLFLWCSASIASLILAPALVVDGIRGGLPREGWVYALLSIGIHAIYFYSLGQAYKVNDFSIAYSMSRGLGVGLTGIGAYFLFDERLAVFGITGICLIVAGIVIVGSFGQNTQKSVQTKSGLFWPLLTGILIGVYSLNDKAGVNYFSPLSFGAILYLGTMLVLTPVVLRLKRQLLKEWQENKKTILLAAICNIGAYPLVLFAFQIDKAGYVVAGREMSIVFGVLIGAIWLKEENLTSRLTGALSILCGVTFMVLS